MWVVGQVMHLFDKIKNDFTQTQTLKNMRILNSRLQNITFYIQNITFYMHNFTFYLQNITFFIKHEFQQIKINVHK